MKYAIIIPDGCADEPQEVLGGKTPLPAAHTPNMDRVARAGVVGLSNNVPDTLTPASDVATLSLFGYDPLLVYTGRAPLEAAAMGIALGPNDWAIRCNLVTVANEEMRDFTAGHIGNEEGKALLESVNAYIGGRFDAEEVAPGAFVRLVFVPRVSYRNLLIFRPEGVPPPFSAETKTQPPHDIPDQPIVEHLPRGLGGEMLLAMMMRSREVMADHPVNLKRLMRGQKPATQ